MPTITLNKKVFEKLVGRKLPLEQLKDRISMLGTDLEKIEGNNIEVEIFPNRPDMLSEQGFARAFSSFIGVKKGLRKYNIKKSNKKVIVDSSVKDIRPFTACAIVKGLKFDDEKIREIVQIQEKLHVTYGRNRKKVAIGVYPLEKITFPVTYKADKPERIKFRPLEAKQAMTGLQILSQHKTGREFGHLLEKLSNFPYFIDSKKQILSMPPIINSHDVGKISEKTKDVFVECSGFDYKTLQICLNIVVTALSEMGGEINSLELKYSNRTKISPNLDPEKMKLDLEYVNKRLGLNLKEKEAVKLLERMGFGFEKGNVLIPAYRSDILHQVDLIEDIAIAYGYENFEEEIPEVATIGEENKLKKFHEKIRDILVGFRLLEVKNYHLLGENELNKRMNKKEKLISLKNSLGEYNCLRNSVLPSLIKNLNENQHNEFPQNMFEIGKVFSSGSGETGIKEIERLSIVLCHEQVDFTEIKQILDGLMRNLGLECSVKESKHSSFISGRAGSILISGKNVGILGEINPEVLSNWELTMPVACLEIDLSKIFELL